MKPNHQVRGWEDCCGDVGDEEEGGEEGEAEAVEEDEGGGEEISM